LRHALKSPPHITLYPPFSLEGSRAPDLVRALHAFKKNLVPFCIILFPKGHILKHLRI
jgi:2'-5' RNA ligase